MHERVSFKNGRWIETPLRKVIFCNYEPFILMNKGRAAQFRWQSVSRQFTAAGLLNWCRLVELIGSLVEASARVCREAPIRLDIYR